MCNLCKLKGKVKNSITVFYLSLSRNVDGFVVNFMRISISVFMCVAAIHLWINVFDQNYKDYPKIIENQDVLQLVSLFAIFGSVLAYIFKVIIQKEMVDENRHFTEAQVFKSGALTQYYGFKMFKIIESEKKVTVVRNENKKEDEEELKSDDLLNKAIRLTRDALRIAERLNCKNSRNEILICTCKNNLAWYLAEKEINTPESRALIKYCMERKTKYPNHAGAWLSTQAFVEKQFSKVENIRSQV